MKREIINILLAMVLLVSMSLVTATPAMAEPTNTYYVAVTGSNSNDGSQDHPWNTIEYALNQASPGDTIYITAGEYREDNFEITKSLTVRGANYRDSNGDYITQTIIKVDTKTGEANTLGSSSIVWVHDCQDVSISWLTLDLDGKAGTGVYFCGDCDFNSTVSDCMVQGTPATAIEDNVFCAMEALNFASNITFERNIIKGAIFPSNGYAAGIGFIWGTSNITVKDNVIDGMGTPNNGISGIAVGNGLITGNTITGCENGIYQNQIDLEIRDNTIYGNNIGIYADSTWQCIIRNNSIYNNNTCGVTTDSGQPDVDAKLNFWGKPSGPYNATLNPTGMGEKLGNDVDFVPWLLVSPDEVTDETEVEETGFNQQSKTFTGTDTTIDTTGTAGTGDITVTTGLYSVPEDAVYPLPVDAEGERALKYVDVKIENSTYTGNVTVTMSYTEADLARMGVKEDTLKLYYFKMSNGPWTLAANQVLDMVNNIVSGDIPASELTGTPLCLGGEAIVTGQYEIGAPPSVTVNFTPTEMDPTVEQTVIVGVSVPTGRTLAELTQVLFKVWYDVNSGTPTEPEFNNAVANTQTCAVITWNGTTFSLDANAGDTTWSLGECTAPALTGTSGDFTLKFTSGKVATETTFGAVWQLAATATSEYGTGFGFDAEGTAMNWYGEMTLGSAVNVDWGSVPAGMDFAIAKAKQALGTTITYISNGAYNKLVKSGAIWAGAANNAALNADGTPGGNEFSLKAYNSDDLGEAELLDTTGSRFDTGTITGDTGSAESDNYLWLKLGTPFSQDTYSGTITYIIQPGVN